MTGPPGWQTPHYVLASAAFGHRTRTVTIGLFRRALRWKPQPEAGQYMPKRRAVVRERLDRWLTPTPLPQRNRPIATGCLLSTAVWAWCRDARRGRASGPLSGDCVVASLRCRLIMRARFAAAQATGSHSLSGRGPASCYRTQSGSTIAAAPAKIGLKPP